jgi:hypothetical protein
VWPELLCILIKWIKLFSLPPAGKGANYNKRFKKALSCPRKKKNLAC